MPSTNKNRPRVAIVHDALVAAGGAERTVTHMCEAFLEAPVFTSAYLPEQTYPEFRARQVVVLSSTTSGAKFIRPPERMQHACYCYASFRFLWKPESYSTMCLPNVADAPMLLKAMDTDLKVPDDIRLFKKPVAGFIGNLSSHSEIICQNLQQRAIPKVNHP